MSTNNASRSELLYRWRGIEEEEEDNDDNDPSKSHRVNQRKEEWFADAFNFLICLPIESHIWCGYCDIMGPLVETFYNYVRDERQDSPLRLLWKRMSLEMQHCIQCVSKHHEVQEMYDMEYEHSSIGPLLSVLRNLDEERVAHHLQGINSRLASKEYVPERDNAAVVSVMYEVLMYPVLLDDQSLFIEFEKFIEAVDNMHELALAGDQQFPGVYALLFFNRRVRIIGHRLARSMGKLRRATDLEPLQPLLKKFVCFLETEEFPSPSQLSRPRSQLERLAIWLGFTSLLEFLEPPAFEDGILERYPIFFDIVLNHSSGDSPEFSQAVSCLKELFKMLGCKLWLRSTLSPSVMRNTLLGQCFHTRNEKTHKVIFDLFQPFLQSLEALGDGEHEKQRRNFLYFLLHQVPVSNNFSALTKNIGCKIAILIIHRGYQMNPPCPPFECSHMWGPALVSSLKDSSLHSSLRQPAFDLVQTIMVSDATALITTILNCNNKSSGRCTYVELSDDEDSEDLPFSHGIDERDSSSWSEFTAQSKITSLDCKGWMCIPMLWIDILVDLNPWLLPISFSKAVFWAQSCFCLVEPETTVDLALDVKAWVSSSSKAISTTLGWKVPTGSDDGGGGVESKNSLKVSTMCLPLTKTFKRLTAHFLVQMGQGELRKQWTWEPRMAESLILSLMDPNDNMRQFGKYILEQVSSTRGLACGLKFLCSSSPSLPAVFLGVKHAFKLVQIDSVLLNFQCLHHFLFVLYKLLKEWDFPKLDLLENSLEGGFLKQPVFDCVPVVKSDCQSSSANTELQEKFCYLLSEVGWPPIKKCLIEGKAFIDYSHCQMACVRLLEILPVLLEKLLPSFCKHSGKSIAVMEDVFDFQWLHDLMDWGKSQLKVVVTYWKRTLTSLLNLLKGSCSNDSVSALAVKAIENINSCDGVDMEELTGQVSRLCVSLRKGVSYNSWKTQFQTKTSSSECFPFKEEYAPSGLQSPSVEEEYTASSMQPPSVVEVYEASSMQPPSVVEVYEASSVAAPTIDNEVQTVDSEKVASRSEEDVIVLSDDDIDKPKSDNVTVPPVIGSRLLLDSKAVAPADKNSSHSVSRKKNVHKPDGPKYLLDVFGQKDSKVSSALPSQNQDLDKSRAKAFAHVRLKSSDGTKKEKSTIGGVINNTFSSLCRANSKNETDKSVSSRQVDQISKNMISTTSGVTLKELVCNGEDDPLESAFKTAKHKPLFIVKSGPFVPKRQVIQLKSPFEHRPGHMSKLGEGFKRFKPPRLENWYRRILELDYFATVGVATANEDENKTFSKFKEVPVCFQSSEQYVNIFQPLVLEEFKAQLQNSFQEMSSCEEMYIGNLSVLSIERVDDFHMVRFVYEENNSMTSSCLENDLVLLTKDPFRNRTHEIHMIGKVEKRERDGKRRSVMLLIRFYFQNGCLRLSQARRNLLERSKWHVSRILSITPQIREFQALSSINDIPLLPVILKPISGSSHERKEPDLSKLSQPLQQILKSSFNESQIQAVSASLGLSTFLKDFELSLIQGPPGTGKTRTILAIVSCLLASSPQRIADTTRSMNENVKQFPTNSKGRMNQSAAIARAWQDAALARQLHEDVEVKKSTECFSRVRVLLCAQSNAAVDELVCRISSTGLYGRDGKMYQPYLVRVGNAKTVHPNSLPFFIDTLVDQRLAEEKVKLCSDDSNDNSGLQSSTTLRSTLEKLADRIRFFEAKRANIKEGTLELKNITEDETNKEDDAKEMSNAELEATLRKLYEQKKQVYKDLSIAQRNERKLNDEIKALRHKLRKSILKEAQIVVTTLSGSGGDLYGVCSESLSSNKFSNPSEQTLFDAIVIDEAAQALEPATLIPLQLLKSKGTKCIMVGDPKQLPATVLSNVASKYLYECSMFERVQRAGHPVVMLTQQYRMHPEICRFPSLHFYDSKLLNGVNIANKTAPFHEAQGLGPYVFYDIVDGQEVRGNSSGAMSLCNENEADAAVQLLKFFRKRYPSEFIGGRIGIITPYKRQLSILRSRFISAFGSYAIADMEFNTVDGFQGREVDILVLSTVRSVNSCRVPSNGNSNAIGFVADVRRMNVALTRAKLSLWILGNVRTLQTDHNWSALVKDARERNLVTSVKRPYESMFDKQNSGHLSYAEKVDSQLAKQGQHRANIPNKSQTKNIDVMAPRNGKVGDDINVSSKRGDTWSNKRRVRDEHGWSTKKDLLPGVAHEERRTPDSVRSVVTGAPYVDYKNKEKGKRKDMTEMKLNLEKANPHKRNKNERHDMHKNPNLNIEKEPNKYNQRDRSRMESVNPNRSTEGVKKHREENPGIGSNAVPTSEDLITKRKRQREAVDAILNSSLISSKKSEQSFKAPPARRPQSSTSKTSDGIKVSKARKGPK